MTYSRAHIYLHSHFTWFRVRVWGNRNRSERERERERRVFLAMARVAADRTISGLAKRLSGCVLSVPGSVPQGMFAGWLSVYFCTRFLKYFQGELVQKDGRLRDDDESVVCCEVSLCLVFFSHIYGDLKRRSWCRDVRVWQMLKGFQI